MSTAQVAEYVSIGRIAADWQRPVDEVRRILEGRCIDPLFVMNGVVYFGRCDIDRVQTDL